MSIVPTTIDGIEIDRVKILQSLKLNPTDPKVQALILLCERYNLDPLLKHMVLVDGNPYVTRDGYLHIAHQSGKFDGIEVVDSGETSTHWTAKVAVWRKDMGRPVTYAGRYPKDGSNKRYGPEMAIKTAEVAALRRAFNVTGIGAADEMWDAQPEPTAGPAQPALTAGEPIAPADAISGLVERLNALPPGAGGRAKFKAAFGDPRMLPAAQLADAEDLVTRLEDESNPGRPLDEEPVPAKKGRTPASQLHVDAHRLGVSEDDLDVLIMNASGGRTSSANDLTDKEIDDVAFDIREVAAGRFDLAPVRTKVAQVNATREPVA